MIDVTQFKREEDFKAWFFAQSDPTTQIESLKAWRQHQQQVVESLSNLVQLLANDQYTQSDHFLLELLQNADDNDYLDGVTPELTIALDDSSCTFICNERGFNAGNVFAICYAAASTKKRRLSGRTFIGEKGIGFKSIFAVAQTVEIHSGDYHFELRDKEYVIPHLIGGERQLGSRVVVHFKPQFKDLSKEVSERLRLLTEESRHFLIFLQKLEKLTVRDRLRKVEKSVQVLRDIDADRCLVQSESNTVEFYVQSFQVEVPVEIVKSRFEDLDESLKREILFAVPLPQDLRNEEDCGGRLFCYLPTEQTTGMPIHIQLDAKTVTNREDIADASTNPWNRFMLEKTSDGLAWLFGRLRSNAEFSSYLPVYLPPDPDDLTTSNDDLAKTVEDFCTKIIATEWVLDRHGDARLPARVRICPPLFEAFIVGDQYEKHLPSGDGSTANRTDTTFLSPQWKDYQNILSNYGVRALTPLEFSPLWKVAGVPEVVRNADDAVKRAFLRAVMKYCESQIIAQWKDCPIFPLRSSRGSGWGALAANVILLLTDIQNPTVPDGTTIVEPAFTISPSGTGKQNDEIRDFNGSFRDFLVSKLHVPRKSDATYLEEIIINGMQGAVNISNHAAHLAVSVKWVEIYYRVWRRQKTLQDESATQWATLMQGIKKCHVPVWRSSPTEVKPTVPISSAMLPVRLGGAPGIDIAYRETGAIVVDILVEEATDIYWSGQARRRESGIDLGDWGDFLRAAGANTGPMVQSRQFNHSSWRHISAPKGTDIFIDEIKQQIPGSDGPGFSFESIDTVTLDTQTAALLYRKDIPEPLTQALVAIWPQISAGQTIVAYNFGSRASATRKILPVTLASSQMAGRPFKVMTREGKEERADDCFLDTEDNVVMAAGVLPLVQSERYSGNREYLTAIGVGGTLSCESIERAIREGFVGGRILHDPKQFAPFLKMVARMAARNKQDRIRLSSSRIFLDPQQDELADYKTWKTRGCSELFDPETRDDLDSAFREEAESSSPEELITQLESINDLGTSAYQLNVWFLQVARALHREDGARLIGLFTELVGLGKLKSMGGVVNEMSCLPIIWNKYPVPKSTVGIHLPPERPDEAAVVLEVADRLGWPTLSRKVLTVRSTSPVELENKTWRLLSCILDELRKLFEKSDGAAASRLADLPMARGIKSLRANLRPVEELALSIDGVESEFAVPFWRSDQGLHVATNGGDIVSAIVEIIDSECHVTVAPFLDMIRERVEPKILEFAGDENDGGEVGLPRGGSDRVGTPNAVASASAEGLLLGDEETEKEPSDDSGKSKTPSVNGGEVRKRLCSFVVHSGTGNGGTAKLTAKQSTANQNEETEKEGAKVLKAFFADRELEAVSVEGENCGYDFKVAIGDRTLCIELKTSRAKWRGWEHALTPNEFKTALEKKEDYFLCVVDRVFEDSREIYFIQNPVGKISDFLFDSPWKGVCSNMADLLSAIKATEGILDD